MQAPRMPKLIAPGSYRGARGSKREPSLSACSLGDIAARRCSAGYRPSRSREAVPRAARAWCPCPGTRHDVPLARCCRGDAGLPSPRRRSRLTSARVAGRAGAAIQAPDALPVHAGRDDLVPYKQRDPAEFLNAWHRVATASPGTTMEAHARCPRLSKFLLTVDQPLSKTRMQQELVELGSHAKIESN